MRLDERLGSLDQVGDRQIRGVRLRRWRSSTYSSKKPGRAFGHEPARGGRGNAGAIVTGGEDLTGRMPAHRALDENGLIRRDLRGHLGGAQRRILAASRRP